MKKTYRRTKYILHAACDGINQPYDFYYSKGYSDKYGFHYRDYTGNMVHIKNQNGHNIFSSKAEMENAGILACTIEKTYHNLRQEAFLLNFEYDKNDNLVDLHFAEGFLSKRNTIFNVVSTWHDSERFVVKKINITDEKYYRVFQTGPEAINFIRKQYGEDLAHRLYKRICGRAEAHIIYCEKKA